MDLVMWPSRLEGVDLARTLTLEYAQRQRFGSAVNVAYSSAASSRRGGAFPRRPTSETHDGKLVLSHERLAKHAARREAREGPRRG